MSHISPVRRIWRKPAKKFAETFLLRKQSTVATASDVQVTPEDHHKQSSCPFHHAGPKLANLATADVSNASYNIHPLLRSENRNFYKSFEDIPSPKSLPIVGTTLDLLACGGAPKMHEYCDRRHKELGPIFRDRLGTEECVVICGKEYIDTVFLFEGKHPVHLVPEAWKIYNDITGTQRGLFFMDGEQWCERRKVLNQALMSPQAVAEHATAFNNVITDMICEWESRTCNQSESDGILDNLEHKLYNWSVESMGTMLFGRRLGCVQLPGEKPSDKHHEFVECVQQIFTESAKMTMIPPKLARALNLPVWTRFCDAVSKAIMMARGYVEERMIEIINLQQREEHVTGVLSHLMAANAITYNEIVSIIADLIIAAADTTSHAAQWALYSLSKNPECQETLLSQIRAAVPPGESIEVHHLEKIPYAMQIVKESLRLYPVASFLTRILPSDIVLGGYKIPAGKLIVMSQYTVGRDKSNFKDPEKFRPERWNRKERKMDPGSRVCAPFGVGVRACVGRRVAECKTPLMLARVVQNFHLESANEGDVGIALRMITAPETPIKLRLRKRHH